MGKVTEHNVDHSAELKRINRIQGQLEGIKRMISENRYCPDILTQIQAANSALRSLEASILQRHLKHCVKSALGSRDKAQAQERIDELIEVFQKRVR